MVYVCTVRVTYNDFGCKILKGIEEKLDHIAYMGLLCQAAHEKGIKILYGGKNR